jgi:predicted MFS family arabinose efflux permease
MGILLPYGKFPCIIGRRIDRERSVLQPVITFEQPQVAAVPRQLLLMSQTSSQGDAPRLHRVPAIAATMLVGVAGGQSGMIMPALLGAFATSRAYSISQTSVLGSVEFTGTTIALLLAGLVIARVPRRSLILLGLSLVIAGELLSLRVGAFSVLLAARFTAGVGEGLLLTAMTTTIASMASPERMFGLYFAVDLGLCTVFFGALPALTAAGGVDGILYIVLAYCVFVGLGSGFIPTSVPTRLNAADPKTPRRSSGRTLGLLGLVGSFILFTGAGTVWPSIAQIGTAGGLDMSVISHALATASLGGIASGLLVSWYGTRHGRTGPILIACAGMAAAMIALLMPFNGPVFTSIVVTFLFLMVFIAPYLMGLLAELDTTGSFASISVALQPAGLALGQLLSAAVAVHGDRRLPLFGGVFLVVSSAALMVVCSRLAARRLSTIVSLP